MLKPVNKRVLCREAPEAKKGLLILNEDKFKVIYDVVAVSDDIDCDILKVGDRIMIDKYFGKDVEIDGKGLLLVPIEKVVGVFCDS